MGYHRDPIDELFAADCERRLEEVCQLWARFAPGLGLGFGYDPSTGLPRLSGRREAVDLAITALGNARVGYRTRASAEVALPLEGRVRVRLPGAIASLLGALEPRCFFREHGVPEMDERFVVSSRPAALARKIIDERAVATLRRLSGQRLDDFTYGGGAVAVVWAGVERDHAVLDGVVDLLVHVAGPHHHASAYR